MAEEYIDLDGNRAIKSAKEAVRKFGQQSQQMTEIAQKAKTLADRYVLTSRLITWTKQMTESL